MEFWRLPVTVTYTGNDTGSPSFDINVEFVGSDNKRRWRVANFAHNAGSVAYYICEVCPGKRASFPDDKIRLVVATQLQAVRHASIVFDVNDSHIDLGFSAVKNAYAAENWSRAVTSARKYGSAPRGKK
jgi:hypothetical protein